MYFQMYFKRVTVHVTGPIEAAKEMMKATRPHNVMIPATLGAVAAAAGAAGTMNRKAVPNTARLTPIPNSPPSNNLRRPSGLRKRAR